MDALTRDTVQTRSRFRPRGWVMALLCLLVVAAIGWAIWFFPSGSPSPKGRDREAGQTIPVVTATATTQGHADLPGWAGHRAGVLHRHHEGHGGWAACFR